MQTIAIQNTPASTPQPAKNAQAPNDDFKQALSRELDRAPVCQAPEPAPAAPAKQTAPQARPAKPAQTASQAPAQSATRTDAADTATTAAPADAAPADPATAAATTSAEPAKTDPATDEAAAAAAPADMLAMLAAYQQLTQAPQPTPDAPAETTDTAATDGTQLTALQTDAAGKRPAAPFDAKTDLKTASARADEKTDIRPQKPATDGTSALQQAQADKAAADQLAKLGDGDGPHAALTTEQKAEAFATKLAEASTQPQPVLPQAAQALAATAQAAQAAAASQLQARVGTNAWEQQLGQKVVWMVAGGDQSASLTLNPPDLGPLQVVLNVSNDSATATFTAAQPETRQAIENALPKLREMMGEAGIALGNATVSAGTQDQQGAFAEQARAAGGGGRRFGNAVDAGPADAPQPVVRQSVLGAVDTFA